MLKKVNSLLSKARYHIWPLSIFLAITVIMILSWFRTGILYGGGDVGLPTYNPIRLSSIVKDIWWDVHAPGFPYPSALTSIPLYSTLAILQTVGMSPVAIQAILFSTLLFLTGLGMYLLFFEATSSKSRVLSFIAALFYMLNPYMEVQIWHRFVHTSFFLAAMMPLITYVYIKLIKSKRLFWYLVFLFISFAFSYIYGSLSFMVIIWIPILTYSIWNNFFRNLKILILVFVSWLAINIWWLYPFWTTGPTLFAQIHSIYASIATLLSLSNQNPISVVLRGINSFYTFGENIWVGGYGHFLMQLISWSIPLVTLIGIYSIIVSKKRHFYVWIFLFLLAIFVSKGTAAPFGHPFLLAFSKSFLLGAFRNPFEKFGILIPFASAFIFPIGIEKICFFLKSKFSGKRILAYVFISTLLVLEFIIYPWPMWLGEIFGSKSQSALVEVPEDYIRANAWIKDENKSGRILHLPFVTGDAVTYSWEKGYNGIEPSSLLFSTPSVSNGFGLEQVDHSLASINIIFTSNSFDQKSLANVFSNLNIRYIVLHKDIDWKARVLVNPDAIEKVLFQISFIQKKVTFGDLVIYEIDDSFFTPKVFTAEVYNVLTGGSIGFSIWPEIYENESWPVFFATPVNDNQDELSAQSNLNYSITSTHTILTPSSPLAYKENALAELPRPRFLPDSLFYSLILIKEQVQLVSSPAMNKHFVELDHAGKRLSEAHRLTEKGNIKLANRMIANYSKRFDKAVEIINQRQVGGLVDKTEKLILKTMLARHEIVLKDLNNLSALENMKIKLSDLGFVPFYELKEDIGMSKYGRKVFRFDVQKDVEYEILLKNSPSDSQYQGGLKTLVFQIDNEVKVLSANLKMGFLSFGTIKLDKGLHEISYNMVDSVNLSPEIGSQEWQLTGSVKQIGDATQPVFDFHTSKTDSSSLSFNIKDFDKNSIYRVDFDYWIKKGRGPILQVMQDSDWDVNGRRYMSIDKIYDKDNYSFYWNSGSIFFEPRLNTTEAVVKINGEPWNNCLAILGDKVACKIKEIGEDYNRESDFAIRNISVKRLLVNDVFLRSIDIAKDGVRNRQKIDINQISPSYYEGRLLLNGPTSLVFLTTFHPEWKVSLTKDGVSYVLPEKRHFLANGYGNLWYLNEDPGEYLIKIEFIPQKRFYKGITFSAVATISSVVVGIFFLRKKRND
ncbi:MAG: alpha-(1-_3)-arabinofuranosyltransferase family protein [Patescibacteria group bacterium]